MNRQYLQRKGHKRDYTESDDSDDEQFYYKSKKKSNVVVPRFVKNGIQKIDTDIIIINVSRTQYQVVENVAYQLGWEVQTSKKSQKWDIMWIDSHIQAHDLFKLNQHQKISHFPSIYVLTRKNFLGRSLMKISKMFPEEYNFFPETWSVPSDLTNLMRYNQKQQEKQIFIFKPENLAQGKGIKITEKVQQFEGKTGIVQVYINNPFLIEGLKFDLRIYVLIMGYDPLRIFIYDEGLGRFATEHYQKAKKKNMKDVHMHLTNYAINKNNHKFIFNKSAKDMGKGHKRSLSAIYGYLKKIGINTEELKKKIDDVIVKTLIVGQPMIAHTYGLAQADNLGNDLCFQILGIDILINEKLEPILLEVNHTPSFSTDTPLDLHIKKNLIKDTLKLLNINVKKKKQKITKHREFIELRSKRKLVKLTPEEKELIRKQNEKQRNEYEQKNLGHFRKIFPNSDTDKYREMLEYSNKIFNEHNGFKNKQNRSLQEERPNSTERKSTDFVTPLLTLKKKKGNYSKTVGIKNKDQPSETNTSKFPSLNMNKGHRNKNFSGYMYKNKAKMQQSQINEQVHNISCTEERIRENIEKEMEGGKGNFLSPKMLEFGDGSQHKLENGESFSSKIINSPATGFNSAVSKSLITHNRRSFEDAVSDMNNVFPLCKRITYQGILNSLKKIKKKQESIVHKIKKKKRFI